VCYPMGCEQTTASTARADILNRMLAVFLNTGLSYKSRKIDGLIINRCQESTAKDSYGQ